MRSGISLGKARGNNFDIYVIGHAAHFPFPTTRQWSICLRSCASTLLVSQEYGPYNPVADAGSRGKSAELTALMAHLGLVPEYVDVEYGYALSPARPLDFTQVKA